jgi:hypothetical protein
VRMSAPNQPAPPQAPPHAPHQGQDEPLFLWDKVLKARSAVAVQRRLPVGSTSSMARAELLSALEAYALSLTNHGRPIPYALRDELRLTRRTR